MDFGVLAETESGQALEVAISAGAPGAGVMVPTPFIRSPKPEISQAPAAEYETGMRQRRAERHMRYGYGIIIIN